MSEQGKGTVFDRYSKRGSLTARDDAPKPSAAPSDTEHNASHNRQPGQETTLRAAPSALEIFSHEAEDQVVQAGMYKAAFIYKAKTRPRLRLHFADGIKVKVLAYAHLVEVVATSHQWLTLVFSSTIVTIKGHHLDTLIDPLQDERVRALICYRPGIHPQPVSHEPCILEIQERGIHEFADEKKE